MAQGDSDRQYQAGVTAGDIPQGAVRRMAGDVRFGSLANIRAVLIHVRFGS